MDETLSNKQTMEVKEIIEEITNNNQTSLLEPKAEEKAEPSESTPPQKPEKPKATFKCLVCGKSYSKKTSLFTHHKTHPEHCVHCGENRGSSFENIYEHNLKHVNIRPFVCKLCGESFLRNQQFVEHEKAHDKPPEEPAVKESKYKCKVCTSNYSNWKLFYKHQQESGHFNEKFLCEICGSEFHSNFLLSQHIRRLHKRTDETFPCDSCSKTFATKPNLDSHIKKIHQNDNKKFVCETCSSSFSSAPNLKQHVKTLHEVEREYECQTCKKPFKAKNRLTRHEKEVHMGNTDDNRMYSCDHCQKKYKRSWHQVRHSQMKHENSNASTATTSSAGTPPTPEVSRAFSTPEINGTFGSPEMNGNFNSSEVNGNAPVISDPVAYYNYQQPQQVPQMPSHTIMPDLNQNPSPYYPNQQPQQNCMPSPIEANTWNANQHTIPQQQYYAASNTQTYYGVNYGEYSHNLENPAPVNSYGVVSAPADQWNHQQPAYWDYQQQPAYQATTQAPAYHQPQQQSDPNNWYYDPNHQPPGIYNQPEYNPPAKTDYSLNQPPNW